jgi:transcription antitermination factor NusG
MPILKPEPDIFPPDLLDVAEREPADTEQWYCLYTLSRMEKSLLRKLISCRISCYSPMVARRFRSPAGRLRTAYTPLFPNYVFLRGKETDRQFALSTNCVSSVRLVPSADRLLHDLRQIHTALVAGVPLTPEARLEKGQWVRVSAGPFKGFEGEVLRREGKTRLLLRLNFLEQGASMELDEAVLKPV